ncbi:hypothetical protein SOVF_032710 [Spinacia oleracea]|uniref:Myb-like domain-containing protein n=1 Tax=Spinacia oleracea TaxID=3562 RepID=A0A9R0IDZ5_SPIOL|nr:uncharacterized protein LOC110787001 [Spinacia oleracea]KNA22628.1 hypothetical protein SOVF_032710 [Spinacia oleracea]
MEEEVSDSTLPWSWVIEALAKSRLVDASLLYELVSKAPPLLEDSGRKAREAAALRCLEGLCGSPNASGDYHLVPEWSKIWFDPAESCEAVLQRIWSETSGSKGALDELKCVIQSFVKHKKASSPRSTLGVLKDMLVNDTHPLFASLKEVSGVSVGDQCVLNIPFDGGDPTSPPLRSDEDDHGDKTMLAEENGCSPRSGIEDQLGQAYFTNGNSPTFRGGISSCHTDNHVEKVEDASHDVDNQCLPRKKLKLDKEYGMQSKHHHSVPVGSNLMCNSAEDGQYHEVIKEYGIHDREAYGKDVDEQSRTYVENQDHQQISPNNDDHCREEIDLSKKNAFLSSQLVCTRDSHGMTETELNRCAKCNKGGQLLSCSASSCPLMFHKSCLGCSFSFDDQGNFCCPFCAYSYAASEYVRAKEKVSVARKELSLFIGGRTGDQPEYDGDTSSGDDVNQAKQNNIDNTAEVKKGANVVSEVAKPHQRSLKGKQLNISHSSAYLNNGFVMATHQQLSLKDRQGAEIIIELSRDPSLIWKQGQDDHDCDGGKFSGDNNELKNRGENTRCKITELSENASSDSISDSDGSPQDKRNHVTSSLPFPRPIRAIPGTPPGRRNKVRWTAEEEAMLKKGVEMYDIGNGRAIPWKNILEYGRPVFRKGRTAVDLKDKWRNLARDTNPKVQ